MTVLSQLDKREDELTSEYLDIMDDIEPEIVETPHGEFDNCRWVEAEAEALTEERKRLTNAISV